jgi:hypothetical protein
MPQKPNPHSVDSSLGDESISCEECRRRWSDPGERWQAFLATIDGARVICLFCPECAWREFGPD